MAKISAIFRIALVAILSVYRYCVSPFLGQRCRFYPSCSAYAQEAILAYGCLKGVWLTLKRLSKCHPGHPGGLDPVPENINHVRR